MGTLIFVWTIIKVVLGISFVIFWHELGHFLLAKWNGVYVKTFSIGFPPRLVRLFRYRETDYVLGSIPLGGYVHMLGEDEGLTEPGPGHPGATDAEGQPRADVEPSLANHPGAFFNKSVWARMAIISAGVVMNVLLGFLCFLAVYLVGGRLETPAIVGGVAAGGPAYEAGLRPGDEVLAIDGEQNVSYQDLVRIVVHSGPEQVVDFTVRRPGEDEPIVVPIRPRRMEGRDMPQVGVAMAFSLQLQEEEPFMPPLGLVGEPEGRFVPGGRVVAAGPAGEEPGPVASAFELGRLMDRYRDRPMTFVIEPEGPGGAGREASAGGDAGDGSRRSSVTVPPVRFIDFGLRMEAGPVVGIREGSPSEAAGLEPGDRIVAVEGIEDYDPMRLPAIAASRVGESLALTVLRGEDELELAVEPVEGESWSMVAAPDSPLNVDTIGLAMAILPEVAAVREGSPAASAGLKAGDTIAGIQFTWPREEGEEAPRSVEMPLGDDGGSWAYAFDFVQQYRAEAIELEVAGRDDAATIAPEPVPDDWYYPGRGLQFQADEAPIPPMSFAGAMDRAGSETLEGITLFYTMLRRLFEGQVGIKALSGPVGIARVAFGIAGANFVEFLWFLGFISINLAVVNFLPIPPLDGGRMVFLIGEAVRGRPLPESWQALPMYLGVIFLLALMVLLTIKDTLQIF